MGGVEKPARDAKLRKGLKGKDIDDLEFEQMLQGRRGYEPEEKVANSKYNAEYVRDMAGKEFNLHHIQKEGFDFPVLIRSKEGLHIHVPKPDFSVRDIRACVGSTRLIDVMDTKTQINQIMTMKQFHKYWCREESRGDKIFNVISLEFSHTRLENFVKAPLVVRQLDWTDRVWPRHLKLMQTEGTNAMEKMMYPKVQKYVLMSVKGCYTDFHIDFGGTSVWYHILKGKKVFFLIPPTPKNLQEYKKWTLSGEQNELFFGDMVEKCGKITLEAGQTFFIPTGWIHAVYTPEDSIIFGGNFLHSFNIQKQLEIAVLEEITHVPQKFRYPFFTEMLWYTMDRYVQVLLGRTYICGNEENVAINKNPADGDHEQTGIVAENDNRGGEKKHAYVTKKELDGLKAIIVFLHRLPCPKKFVPQLITDPVALIRDVVQVVKCHQHDDQGLAVNGKPLLLWSDEFGSLKDAAKCSRVKLDDPKSGVKKKRRNLFKISEVDTFHAIRIARIQQNSKVKRRRRQRCKECSACNAGDCGKCVYCLDMPKFGGLCRLKQTCAQRQCLQPVLPHSLVCDICETRTCEEAANDPSGGLFECLTCGGVAHKSCMARQCPGTEPVIIRDHEKEWQCNKCAAGGSDLSEKTDKPVSAPKVKSSDIPKKAGRGRPRGGGVGKRGRPPATPAASETRVVTSEGVSATKRSEEPTPALSDDAKASADTSTTLQKPKVPTKPGRGRPAKKSEPTSAAADIKRRLVRNSRSPKAPVRGAKRPRRDSVDGRHNLRAKKMKAS